MDQIMGCFLVMIFIIAIISTMISPCSGYAVVVSIIIALLALLIHDPQKLSSPLYGSCDTESDDTTERLESAELQTVTQWGDHKEVDIDLENRIFKETHKNLDNSKLIEQAFGRDETATRNQLTGDDLLAQKMAHVSVKNRNAIHNRVRFTSDNFRKYYAEELDEQEHKIWWERDMLEDDT
jgi:hypothetical protein